MLLCVGCLIGPVVNFVLFEDLAFFGLAAIAMLVLAAAISTSGVGARAKLLPRVPFLIASLAFALLLAFRAQVLFPLSTRLVGTDFHDEHLSEVLQYISSQQLQRPYWRFNVYDVRAANARVTITIPDGCTLRQALDSVSQSVGCSYVWHWHTMFRPPPICANFDFYRSGTEIDYRSEPSLFVNRYSSARNDEHGRETLNSYDSAGNLIETSSQVDDEHGRLVWRVTRTAYDGQGRAVLSTDPFLILFSADHKEKSLTPVIMGVKTIYDSDGRIVETRRMQGMSVTVTGGEAIVVSEGTTVSVSKTVFDGKR